MGEPKQRADPADKQKEKLAGKKNEKMVGVENEGGTGAGKEKSAGPDSENNLGEDNGGLLCMYKAEEENKYIEPLDNETNTNTGPASGEQVASGTVVLHKYLTSSTSTSDNLY
ncbi:unnamed protein product [Penicillium bialowiezense]